jgi:hypothetical protein
LHLIAPALGLSTPVAPAGREADLRRLPSNVLTVSGFAANVRSEK